MQAILRKAGFLVHQQQRNIFIRLQIDHEAVCLHFLIGLRAEKWNAATA